MYDGNKDLFQYGFDTTVDSEYLLVFNSNAYDIKVKDIQSTFFAKTLAVTRDQRRRSQIIRNSFDRTKPFFDSLNTTMYSDLSRKHSREILFMKTLESIQTVKTKEFSEVYDHISVLSTQLRHVNDVMHSKDMHSFYVLKESTVLQLHLSMLDALYDVIYDSLEKSVHIKLDFLARQKEQHSRFQSDVSEVDNQYRNEFNKEKQMIAESRNKEIVERIQKERETEKQERLSHFDQNSYDISSELIFDSACWGNLRTNLMSVAEDNTSLVQSRLVDKYEMEKVRLRDVYAKHTKDGMDALKMAENELTERVNINLNSSRAEWMRRVELEFKEKRDYLTKMQTDYAKKMRISSLNDTRRLERLLEFDYVPTLNAGATPSNSTADKHSKLHRSISIHIFHEMRNALASIICVGKTLKTEHDECERESLFSSLTDICTYATTTLNNMLDVVKISSKSYTVRQDVVEMKPFLHYIISLQGARSVLPLTVRCNIDTAHADKNLLTQLMVNLLSNAVKFTSSGYIELFALKTTNVDNFMDIGVIDSGPGFKKKQLQNDGQLDVDPTGARSSGYGLYLVHTVAKVLGGVLMVKSPCPKVYRHEVAHAVNPGSMIFVRIPLRETHALVAETRMHSIAQKRWIFAPEGEMKVLIIEDQLLLRVAMMMIYRNMAEKYNVAITVETAKTAEEGLRKVAKTKYDIVTLDENFELSDKTTRENNERIPCEEGSQLFFDKHVEGNLSRLKKFKKAESFCILPGDGKCRGSDVFEDIAKNGVCVMVSGAVETVKITPFLTKPFPPESFIDLLGEYRDLFISKKFWFVRNGKIFAHEGLQLFEQRPENDNDTTH